jgi:hypothetical protein
MNAMTEHFCALLTNDFLPHMVTLHRSLVRHASPFHLWILCMDEAVHQNFLRLALPDVTLIPLRELETPRLCAAKPGRTASEYCWTCTPVIIQAVLERDPTIGRVTYLDGDLFFFDRPALLLDELNAASKHVQITEQAWEPGRDYGALYGRFCVQFVTFTQAPQAADVLMWWRERCLEWCYNRFEEGKFADQKYLDSWPEHFGDAVHIVQQVHRTLAPWNIRYYSRLTNGRPQPVFYHFAGLRLVHPGLVRLYSLNPVGRSGQDLYGAYLFDLEETLAMLRAHDIPIPYCTLPREAWQPLKRVWRRIIGTEEFVRISR